MLVFVQFSQYNKINFPKFNKNCSKQKLMTSTQNTSHFLIDQQSEVSKNFLASDAYNNQGRDIEELNRLFNQKSMMKQNARSQGSYQVILEQSLTTQDRPFLYEILIENDQAIIRSSLQSLPPKRVIQLLKMIKSLLQQHIKLGKGQDHCLSIGIWLEYLIKLHLTTIVSNPQNKQVINAIRKFIQKKTHQKSQLQEIKSHLLSEQNAQELQSLNQQQGRGRKNPKFEYIEEEKQNNQDDEQKNQNQSEIKDQDMEGLDIDDLDMDDLLEEDF